MPNSIAAKNVTKYFDSNKVIDNLNFDVQKGEIFGIVGPDGSGKTTLIRLISGIINCTSGKITVAGFDVSKNAEKARNFIGYMPQRFSLYEDLTVEENINFFADLYSVARGERQNRIRELYKFSNLENFKTRFARNLSGGMQKKLALTCALINMPEILILDEPTIGVDPLSREELWAMLRNLNSKKKITIFISTNYMDEVKKFNRVALIYKGSFLLCGEPRLIGKKNISFEDMFISKIKFQENIITESLPKRNLIPETKKHPSSIQKRSAKGIRFQESILEKSSPERNLIPEKKPSLSIQKRLPEGNKEQNK